MQTVTAKEAAAKLGCNLSTLYRNKSLLRGKKQKDHQWVFDATRVEQAAAGVLPLSLGSGSGNRATESKKASILVFEALKRGAPLVDIVIDTGTPPAVVFSLASEYHRMLGAIVVPIEAIKPVLAHPAYMGVTPCDTAEELVSGMLESLGAGSREACVTCGTRPRLLCKVCRERMPLAGASSKSRRRL